MAQRVSWWRRPELRSGDEERRASWLELFVDLIFVAIIATISTTLARDLTIAGVARATITFLPAWWIWIGLTVYNDRFETDDVSNRLSFFVILLALGGLAISARDFFGEGFRFYAASYILARFVLIVLWIRSGLHNPVARQLTTRYATGISISVMLWLAAMAASGAVRMGLVIAAILVDFGTPFTTTVIQQRLPRLSPTHLPERFGLFVIIVLGEMVVGTESVLGIEFAQRTFVHVSAGVAAVALAFVLWWLYFDHVAQNPPLAQIWSTLGWSEGHMVLVLAITSLGAATRALVSESGEAGSASGLAALSVGAAFAMIAYLEFLTEPSHEDQHRRTSVSVHMGSSLLALVLAGFAPRMSPTLVLAILAGLGVAQVVYGLAVNEHQHDEECPAGPDME